MEREKFVGSAAVAAPVAVAVAVVVGVVVVVISRESSCGSNVPPKMSLLEEVKDIRYQTTPTSDSDFHFYSFSIKNCLILNSGKAPRLGGG